MSSNEVTDRLLDAYEVAGWLSVTPAWVHEMARSGDIPAIKLGKYWRFSRQSIEAWVKSREVPASETGSREHR